MHLRYPQILKHKDAEKLKKKISIWKITVYFVSNSLAWIPRLSTTVNKYWLQANEDSTQLDNMVGMTVHYYAIL